MTEPQSEDVPRDAVHKKLPKPLKILFAAFIILIALPLVLAGLSFIGRVGPAQVIPASFNFYGTLRNPARFAGKILAHESLPEILALPAAARFAPQLRQLRDSGLLENPFVRFADGGRLDFALLPKGHFIAAWNMGVLSPLFKLLPLIRGRLKIRQLYYVQAGKLSRFEYRLPPPESGGGQSTLYIASRRNLAIATDDPALLESLLESAIPEKGQLISFRDYDAAFLALPEALFELLGGENGAVQSIRSHIQFSRFVEASISVFPSRLDIKLLASLESQNEEIVKLLGRTSTAPLVTRFLPAQGQYATFLSAGNLEELIGAASLFAGPDLAASLKKADSAARALFRMNLEDILFSWTGKEFAVFGMEGRPSPVYAVQIRDERRRRAVFDRVFSSVFVDENINLNIDGNRIPRIQIPDFLASILGMLDIHSPAPYYLLQDNFLVICESAETLLAWLNSIRRNETLPASEVWQALSASASDRAAAGLFYSLDRSLPFFLKGNTPAVEALRIYRQGLLRLAFESHVRLLRGSGGAVDNSLENIAQVTLSLIPGTARGLVLAAGYPFEPGGRIGSDIYGLRSGGESRVFFTIDGIPATLDPGGLRVKKGEDLNIGNAALRIIPATGLQTEKQNSKSAAFWLSGGGLVALINNGLEITEGFPLITGLRLSAAPSAHGGRLFLPTEDGSVVTVDALGKTARWQTSFSDPIRSPIAFLDINGVTFAAFYPKSFFGQIWLSNAEGAALPGWPIEAPGIAYGTPLLFEGGGKIRAAFVTMAGELWVYNEGGTVLPPFPLKLPGVFYIQPVFDGEYFWLVSSEGTLFRAGLDGKTETRKIENLELRENGFIGAADITGAGAASIFFSGEGNALYGYNRSLEAIPGFPLPIFGRPLIMDLDGDGKAEITGAGMDNRIYRWHGAGKSSGGN